MIIIFNIIIILGVTWGDLDARTDEILSVGFRVLHIFTVHITLHINVSPDMKDGQNVTVVRVSEK